MKSQKGYHSMTSSLPKIVKEIKKKGELNYGKKNCSKHIKRFHY